MVGLMPSDPDPYNFLTIASYEKDFNNQYTPQGGEYNAAAIDSENPISNVNYSPTATLELRLSDKKRAHERQAYTLFTMLGDLGGFNSAIILLPSYLMSFYSARMYGQSVFNEVPKKKKAKLQAPNSIQQKLSSIQELPQSLDQEDIKNI